MWASAFKSGGNPKLQDFLLHVTHYLVCSTTLTASVDGQVAVVRSRRQGSLGQQETDDVCVRECDREVCAVELV